MKQHKDENSIWRKTNHLAMLFTSLVEALSSGLLRDFVHFWKMRRIILTTHNKPFATLEIATIPGVCAAKVINSVSTR